MQFVCKVTGVGAITEECDGEKMVLGELNHTEKGKGKNNKDTPQATGAASKGTQRARTTNVGENNEVNNRRYAFHLCGNQLSFRCLRLLCCLH